MRSSMPKFLYCTAAYVSAIIFVGMTAAIVIGRSDPGVYDMIAEAVIASSVLGVFVQPLPRRTCALSLAKMVV